MTAPTTLPPPMTRARLEELLSHMASIRVGVIGDACLDVYWDADMTLSRLARENPHYILPVIGERVSPGGGSNAAACVAALAGQPVPLLGVVGADWRGRELSRLLPTHGVSDDYLVKSGSRITTAYCKPLRRGYTHLVYEDPHLYFENHIPMSSEDEDEVLAQLKRLVNDIDALIVADYLEFGVVTDRIRDAINKAAIAGLPIIVDSRDRITQYRHVTLKPNDLEAEQAIIPGTSSVEMPREKLADVAGRLARSQESDVCLTMGEQGCLWAVGGTIEYIPTVPAPPPIDIVGAGDCFAAAFTTARAAGASGPEAAAVANLAAAVVVRKLNTTGTASAQEIMNRYDVDYNGGIGYIPSAGGA